jgi:hypothetical protein
MNNLIITIIGIALVSVAAAMAVFYGGTAYEQANINAVAGAIISESNQILTAQRIYAVNHGQADATGVNFYMLLTDGELGTYPPIGGGQLATSVPNSVLGAETYNFGLCYNYNGYQGGLIRVPFTYHGGNYVVYQFMDNDPYAAPCFRATNNYPSNPKHSIMLLAQAINQQMGLPPGITLFEGIPINMTSNYTDSSAWSVPNGVGSLVVDTNGNPMTNMCYYPATFIYYDTLMTCVFGPS